MSFETHNTTHVNVNGTSFMGHVYADYRTLCKIFGEPTESDGYKSDAEWMIQFSDGKVATIYNWKDGKNYCGANGLNVEDITGWHIGGNSKEVAYRIQNILSNPWPVFDEIRREAASS